MLNTHRDNHAQCEPQRLRVNPLAINICKLTLRSSLSALSAHSWTTLSPQRYDNYQYDPTIPSHSHPTPHLYIHVLSSSLTLFSHSHHMHSP